MLPSILMLKNENKNYKKKLLKLNYFEDIANIHKSVFFLHKYVSSVLVNRMQIKGKYLKFLLSF